MTGPFVYFLQGETGGVVKIGVSYSPAGRLKTMMAWSPVPLVLLATTPGDYVLEQYLHRKFSAHRSHSEWFHPAPELMLLIENCRSGTFKRPYDPNTIGRLPHRDGYKTVYKFREFFQAHGITVQDIADEFNVSHVTAKQLSRVFTASALPHLFEYLKKRGISATLADFYSYVPELPKPFRPRPNFALIPDAIDTLVGERIRLQDRTICGAILRFVNARSAAPHGNDHYYSLKQMSAAVGVSGPTLRRHLDSLVAAGLLVRCDHYRFAYQFADEICQFETLRAA